jgi:hypothetical protein
MIKMLIYVGLAATFIKLEENKVSFVISILIFYVIYTVFDVNQVLKDMRTLNPKKEDSKE